uniref:Uncharacterized protein n=1 Tax=Plectus sambesii TaxID=2011161 RepID=A0A914V6V3_9BILA
MTEAQMSFATCSDDSNAAECILCGERQSRSLMRQHLALRHEQAFVDAMLGGPQTLTASWLKSCLAWASLQWSVKPAIDQLSSRQPSVCFLLIIPDDLGCKEEEGKLYFECGSCEYG